MPFAGSRDEGHRCPGLLWLRAPRCQPVLTRAFPYAGSAIHTESLKEIFPLPLSHVVSFSPNVPSISWHQPLRGWTPGPAQPGPMGPASWAPFPPTAL